MKSTVISPSSGLKKNLQGRYQKLQAKEGPYRLAISKEALEIYFAGLLYFASNGAMFYGLLFLAARLGKESYNIEIAMFLLATTIFQLFSAKLISGMSDFTGRRFILIVSSASSFTLSAVGLYTECFWLVLVIGGVWSICNNYTSVSRAWLMDVIAERESYAPAFSLFATLSIASGITFGATIARVCSAIFFTFRTSFLVAMIFNVLNVFYLCFTSSISVRGNSRSKNREPTSTLTSSQSPSTPHGDSDEVGSDSENTKRQVRLGTLINDYKRIDRRQQSAEKKVSVRTKKNKDLPSKVESTLFSLAPKNPEWITAAACGVERNEERDIRGPYTECDEDQKRELILSNIKSEAEDENEDDSGFEESSATKEQKVAKKSHKDSKHKLKRYSSSPSKEKIKMLHKYAGEKHRYQLPPPLDISAIKTARDDVSTTSSVHSANSSDGQQSTWDRLSSFSSAHGPLQAFPLISASKNPTIWLVFLLATSAFRILQFALVPSLLSLWYWEKEAASAGGGRVPSTLPWSFTGIEWLSALSIALFAASGFGAALVQPVLLAITGEPGVAFLSLLFHTVACGLLFSSGSRNLTSGNQIPENVQAARDSTYSSVLFLFLGSPWISSLGALVASMYPPSVSGEVQGVVQQVSALANTPTLIAVLVSITMSAASKGGSSMTAHMSPFGLLYIYAWPGAPAFVAMLLFFSSAVAIVVCYRDEGLCGVFRVSLSNASQNRLHHRSPNVGSHLRHRDQLSPSSRSLHKRLKSDFDAAEGQTSEKTCASERSTVDLQKDAISSNRERSYSLSSNREGSYLDPNNTDGLLFLRSSQLEQDYGSNDDPYSEEKHSSV